MKLVVVVAAAAMLASAPAVASPPGETPPVDEAPGAEASAEASVPDMRGPAWKARMKAKFDTDHDGVLSPEERWVARQMLRRHRGGAKRVRMFDRAIQRFDRDGDGVLGPGEAPPRLLQKLRRLDRDGDGWLTRDEVVRQRQGQGRGQGRGQGQGQRPRRQDFRTP